MMHRSTSRHWLRFLLLATLAACGNSDADTPTTLFVTGSSEYGAAGGTPLAVQGAWLAFLADEASSGGTDLNNDGGLPLDSVAIVVNTSTKVETNLGVAATELVWVGTELYLVVDEVLDGHEHGGAGVMTDLVLMRWNPTLNAPLFVATLDRLSVPRILTVGETLFFAGTTTPLVATESTIFAIDVNSPGMARSVFTQDMVGPLSPRLLGEQDGLVLLVLDETFEARELNDDGVAGDDALVLALLDGTGFADPSGYEFTIRNTELAISALNSPYRAVKQTGNDWLLGFLVSEAAQGANFNLYDGSANIPPSWQIAACSGIPDADMSDRVLHVIRFANWDLDPVATPPYNTGIAGSDRVLIVGDAVATVALESDENNCVFNGDGDFGDQMLRWIRMDGGPFGSNGGPTTSATLMIALDVGLPGPARSVAEVDNVFVIQADEAADGRDYDGNAPVMRDLIGWLDPLEATPGWRFNHSTATTSYATATWMSELPGRTRLGIAYAESSNGVDLNGNGNATNSVPTFADLLAGSPRRLAFPGASIAVEKANAGISLVSGWGFFRVSEVEQGFDINANAQADDILLFRLGLGSGQLANMGALNTLARPAIESEADGIGIGAAFLFDETIIGANISGDMDAFDLVPRFFRVP